MALHPLEPLDVEEIRRAVDVIRDERDLQDAARFAYVALDEPAKQELARFESDPMARPVRRARVVIVPGPRATLVEALVDLDDRRVTRWDELDSARPAMLFEEAFASMEAVRAHPQWLAAMAKRGVTDPTKVQIDPWPAGNFGLDHEDDRRIARCLFYYREEPLDNGYARPIEGVIAFTDLGTAEVLEVIDYGVVPIPPGRGAYRAVDRGPADEGLRPLEIIQPDGPSFVVDGHRIRWQHWDLRVSMDPYEGLVLHSVGWEDAGRTRPILHRASVSEMVVPYGDGGPMHGWKNAFDVGEWGLGRLAHSLELGCDCLGEIRYFDATFADEQGNPYTLANAICLHEEDYGILWKHRDDHGGTTEVRRSRRLVVSFIATVGNYDYGFYWYFYLDGTIQLEVKLTGMLSTMAVSEDISQSIVSGDFGDDDEAVQATMIAPGLAAPYHQHLFNVRLDLDVDGSTNTVSELDAVAVDEAPDHVFRNTFTTRSTVLARESEARRDVDASRSRVWKIENPDVRNRQGRPVAYKLVPGPTPTLLAASDSSVARRAAFARHNLWVTPYEPGERRAAGDHPNQHPGGDGLPAWTSADRDLVGTDVVLWHTFGVTHIPRPEDWPVMPVEYAGFHLFPVGFFDENPALDVAPPPGHCHD